MDSPMRKQEGQERHNLAVVVVPGHKKLDPSITCLPQFSHMLLPDKQSTYPSAMGSMLLKLQFLDVMFLLTSRF